MDTVAKVVEGVAVAALLVFVLLMEQRRRPGHDAGREVNRPEPPRVEQARTALDVAFERATDQYYAGLETGQGGRMPTREQVAAGLASVTGEHDEVALTHDEALRFAVLAAGFHRAFRPPIGSERIDPDGTTHRW